MAEPWSSGTLRTKLKNTGREKKDGLTTFLNPESTFKDLLVGTNNHDLAGFF